MRWLVLVFAVGCAHANPTSCAGWPTLAAAERSPFPPLARRDAYIASVQIVGAPPALAAMLRGQLVSKVGDRLADAPLGDDVRNLWSLGVFSDVRVEATRAVGGIDVAFVVTAQPLVESVAVVGSGRQTPEVRRLKLLAGTPLEPMRVLRMAKGIERSYQRDGHLEAAVAVHRSGAKLCFAAELGPRVVIGAIRFRGRRAIDEKRLLALIGNEKSGLNRKDGIYDEAALAIDRLRLAAEYYEHGYATAQIGDPIVIRRGSRLVLEIPIREGPQFTLGEITISRRPARSALRAGELFSPTRVRAEVKRLEQLYGGTTVVPLTKIDLASRRIALTFEIQWTFPWDIVRSLH